MIKKLLTRFMREDQGQDLIEYAFLAIFIGLAVTLGLQAVATGVNSQMSNIGTQVSSGSYSPPIGPPVERTRWVWVHGHARYRAVSSERPS